MDQTLASHQYINQSSLPEANQSKNYRFHLTILCQESTHRKKIRMMPHHPLASVRFPSQEFHLMYDSNRTQKKKDKDNEPKDHPQQDNQLEDSIKRSNGSGVEKSTVNRKDLPSSERTKHEVFDCLEFEQSMEALGFGPVRRQD